MQSVEANLPETKPETLNVCLKRLQRKIKKRVRQVWIKPAFSSSNGWRAGLSQMGIFFKRRIESESEKAGGKRAWLKKSHLTSCRRRRFWVLWRWRHQTPGGRPDASEGRELRGHIYTSEGEVQLRYNKKTTSGWRRKRSWYITATILHH